MDEWNTTTKTRRWRPEPGNAWKRYKKARWEQKMLNGRCRCHTFLYDQAEVQECIEALVERTKNCNYAPPVWYLIFLYATRVIAVANIVVFAGLVAMIAACGLVAVAAPGVAWFEVTDETIFRPIGEVTEHFAGPWVLVATVVTMAVVFATIIVRIKDYGSDNDAVSDMFYVFADLVRIWQLENNSGSTNTTVLRDGENVLMQEDISYRPDMHPLKQIGTAHMLWCVAWKVAVSIALSAPIATLTTAELITACGCYGDVAFCILFVTSTVSCFVQVFGQLVKSANDGARNRFQGGGVTAQRWLHTMLLRKCERNKQRTEATIAELVER